MIASKTARHSTTLATTRPPHAVSTCPTLPADVDAIDEARLREDVARRLARACAHLGSGSFACLVQAIVDRKLRWARRDAEAMVAALAERMD